MAEAPPATPPVTTPATTSAPPVPPDSAPPTTPPADPPKADWPDDWRSKISADEKHAKDLAKFASPKAIYESYRAMQQRLSTGELRSVLPENASPEDVAKYRKDNGIPEKAEGYLEGLQLQDADKPAMEAFAKAAHDMHLHPKTFKSLVEWRQKTNAELKQKQEELDATTRQQTEDAYRAEWGNDYRRNQNLITGLLDATTSSKELREDLMETMKVNPEIGRWLMKVVAMANPVATVVHGDSASTVSSIEDEIASIEKLMRDNRDAYNKDEAKQARLRELYAARDRHKKAA